MGEVVGQKCIAIVEDPPTHQSHRRKLNPFFYPDALKAMVDGMVEGAASGIQRLDEKVSQGGGVADFDVLPDLYCASNQILTRTMLSSDVERGRQLYKCQTQLVEILYGSLSKLSFWIPGYRFFPTKDNREIASLKSEMRNLLTEIIGARTKAFGDGNEGGYGDDILGQMLMIASTAPQGTTKGAPFNLESVVDNTQMFYMAGQDTVAVVVAFAMLMLARHPEWQDRAQKEVNEVLASGKAIDVNGLNRLKIVGMVINETLRLFSSLPRIPKVAVQDVQVRDLFIPKGLTVEVAVQSMHLDPALWGEDVHKFNPERFANGPASASTHPQAFLPFSAGLHYCLGTNYAMNEMKIMLAMMLQRFQILVSPHYKHRPYFAFVQRPKYGMRLILKRV
ncbi:hypothetical protein KC19_11G040600 [Ceratodon purpureus]|nr:hypothetical protein KC19_11G040600 [Ceratodon purpureus]